jgi:hypothetical protein
MLVVIPILHSFSFGILQNKDFRFRFLSDSYKNILKISNKKPQTRCNVISSKNNLLFLILDMMKSKVKRQNLFATYKCMVKLTMVAMK